MVLWDAQTSTVVASPVVAVVSRFTCRVRFKEPCVAHCAAYDESRGLAAAILFPHLRLLFILYSITRHQHYGPALRLLVVRKAA